MSRTSVDQFKNGTLWNGYDYDVQVWVLNGIVQRCGHPGNGCGCNGLTFAGMPIGNVRIACKLDPKSEVA